MSINPRAIRAAYDPKDSDQPRTPDDAPRKRSLIKWNWRRLRVQLGGCILVSVIIPGVIAYFWFGQAYFSALMYTSLLASFASACVGTWLFRSLSTYPGLDAGSHVIPAFLVSYSTSLAILFVGRLDYNRTILISGFIGSIFWYYFVNIIVNRQKSLMIGALPDIDISAFSDISNISWQRIAEPGDVNRVNAIVADLRTDMPPDWERCLADCALRGIPVYHVKSLVESLTGRVELEHLSENSFGSLSPIGAYMTVKHVLDWLAAALLLLTIWPLLIAVGIAIRLESKGPAIFRQQRMGYRGRPFTVFKFRTMRTCENPLDEDGRKTAITLTGDARITRLGAILRRTRIDELPQLANVIRGDMSLIGPRPEAEVLSRWYESDIPFYRYRHIVRPGITGWAQVNQGHVAEIDEVRTKLYFDFYYIKNYSIWIDILIAARTVRTILSGFGSK